MKYYFVLQATVKGFIYFSTEEIFLYFLMVKQLTTYIPPTTYLAFYLHVCLKKKKKERKVYACRVHYVHTVLQAVSLIFCCMAVVPTPFKRTNKDKYTLKYDKKIIYLQNRTVAVVTPEKK